MKFIKENDERRRGYGWFLAAIFVVGETAGSGMVAMPRAVMNTGEDNQQEIKERI